MASITVTGNLTANPELRFTPAGKAVLSFGLAENHHRRTPDGQWEQTGTSFYQVTRWAGPSSTTEVDAIAASLRKGARVIVTGRFASRDWTDRDGVTRTSLEVTADDVGVSFRAGSTLTIHPTHRTDQPLAEGGGDEQPPT